MRESHGFKSEEALLAAWKENKYDADVVACLLNGQQRYGAPHPDPDSAARNAARTTQRSI